MDRQRVKKIGKKTIEVMEYGGYRTKKIRRMVYSEPTLTKGFYIYWFQLWRGNWRNTSKEGIRSGIVVGKREFERIK